MSPVGESVAHSVPAGLAAGLTVALAATSLTGVLTGSRWWILVVVAVLVVAVVGILLRLLRLPSIVVAAGQLTALAGLVTAMFTSSGVLTVLPGPDALGELRSVLYRAVQQVHGGVPPVPETTELLCLVMLGLGLVAVAVDTITVTIGAPAVAGLVLLCLVAVPASLSDELLPWWSFALGALGFALLLTIDGRHRHLTKGGPIPPGRRIGAAPTTVAVGVVAIAAALLAGATLTAVGTEGKLIGGGRSTPTGVGVNPFTALHGQLTAGADVELFRVRGLGQQAYLRALTLSHFAPGQGWQQGTLDAALPAGDESSAAGLPLPGGVAEPVAGPMLQVQIEPINYTDHWLPTFGYPLRLKDIGTDWRYDPEALTVFAQRRQRAGPYTEVGMLPQPDPGQLRAAGPGHGPPFTSVDPEYVDTTGVDSRVAELAAEVTAGTPTALDATIVLTHWFTDPANGFRYDLRTTAGSSGDALVDFLFTGRTGYCEQFASAMAIMLRTLGIPARVAVGFTPGTPGSSADDPWLITTDDAHAWVEVWFPGTGWLTFDPTPLGDGRAVVPDYVAASTGPPPSASSNPPPSDAVPTNQATPVPPAPVEAGAPERTTGDRPDGPDIGRTVELGVGGVLVLAAAAGCTPLAVRELRRRRRLQQVAAGGPDAVSAAWEEVLAESADRGGRHPAGETIRRTAQRLASEHGLDGPGRDGLRVLVRVVERAWYGGDHGTGDHGTGDHGNGQRADHRFTEPGTARDDSAAQEIPRALDAVRNSMARCAPAPKRARLLPRSVLRRRR